MFRGPFTRLAARFAIFWGIVLAPLGASARSDLIGPGECAIIVASRPSLVEARQYARQNAYLDVQGIFRSSNGWYAVSIGNTDKARSEAVIADMVRSGSVPGDTYCSNGAAYTGLVWAPGTNDSPTTGTRSARTSQTAPDAGDPTVDGSYSTEFHLPFDARPLSRDEKRFLQAGLAVSGHYNGLIDGVWGTGTHEAFERFSREELDLADVNLSAAVLGISVVTKLVDEEWNSEWFTNLGVSMLVPGSLITISTERDGSFRLESRDGSVTMQILAAEFGETVGFHNEVERRNDPGRELYRLRRDGLMVTAGQDGSVASFVRSHYDKVTRRWITLISASLVHDATGTPELMIASYAEGRGTLPSFEEGGHLENLMLALAQALEEREKSGTGDGQQVATAPPVAQPAPPRSGGEAAPESASGSGTGFYINADGHVMTNSHVVEGCDRLTVDGHPATVTAESESFDLAVLEPLRPRGSYRFLSFADQAARLNSDITVAGFPLAQLLGGLNITRGSISSIEGMGGDTTQMQITAPVQPGNSGGPIVNRAGHVVGIVVSKLDAAYALATTGDIPQNVNFGIRGAIGVLFAEINGIPITKTTASEEMQPEDLAERLQDATVLIECN